MDGVQIAAEQKLLIERSAAQAQAYANLIMLAGYAGLFAIWQLASSHITPLSSFSAGVLIILSLATFVGWEIYAMHRRSRQLMRLALAADDPERIIENIKNYQIENAIHAARMARVNPLILKLTIAPGALAAAIVLSAFVHGLWLTWGLRTTPLELLMVKILLALGCGAFLACAFGFVFVRHMQKREALRVRRNLAQSLIDELRVSANLFPRIEEHWKENGFILYLHLDEIYESRVDYQNARPHLPQIADGDLRARISNYYRKSLLSMERLRGSEQLRFQNKSALDGAPAELERAMGTEKEGELLATIEKVKGKLASNVSDIEEVLAEIESHRLTALDLVDRLERI